MTIDDIMADYWAHRFYENPKEKNSFVDENWDEAEIEAEFAAEAEAEEAAQVAEAALKNPDEWDTL